MVHEILQFTPSITFCYVLHRCESRDIHCRVSFSLNSSTRPHAHSVNGARGEGCFDNDLSEGSPTETLLQLLLPLNDKVQWTSRDIAGQRTTQVAVIRTFHRIIQSVGATDGVYKGQGRSQRELMTRTY
ncbi:hypothetical protein MTR67_016000 [Solanum verrucosum]|uniref:Uncharacterized protein n=1 Tax=Solanum verrucosum TaxID=315347 RepID=A0AAF0TQY4_SOLVR|nr:hypothetical protein MTR67_016000 [Solanum verrucosum]